MIKELPQTLPEDAHPRAKRNYEIMPERCKRPYLLAVTGTGSPRNAIKAMCQACFGWEDMKDIGNCASRDCALWPYRPYQSAAEDKDEGTEGEETAPAAKLVVGDLVTVVRGALAGQRARIESIDKFLAMVVPEEGGEARRARMMDLEKYEEDVVAEEAETEK